MHQELDASLMLHFIRIGVECVVNDWLQTKMTCLDQRRQYESLEPRLR